MSPIERTVRIAVADDHVLFRKGLINLIHSLGNEYVVVAEASDGIELLAKVGLLSEPPDLITLDIHMPGQDGFETAVLLTERFPDVRILVISMIEKEEVIVRMLKMGVKGYLSKDVEPACLRQAMDAIMEKGFYYTDFITGRLLHELQRQDVEKRHGDLLNERERTILRLACSELTYKQIADEMNLSVKTVDTYRDHLFKKLGVVSRVGLVIYAIKKGIVDVK